MYQKLDKILMDQQLEIPLVSVSKWHREPAAEEHVRGVHRLQPGLRNGYIVDS